MSALDEYVAKKYGSSTENKNTSTAKSSSNTQSSNQSALDKYVAGKYGSSTQTATASTASKSSQQSKDNSAWWQATKDKAYSDYSATKQKTKSSDDNSLWAQSQKDNAYSRYSAVKNGDASSYLEYQQYQQQNAASQAYDADTIINNARELSAQSHRTENKAKDYQTKYNAIINQNTGIYYNGFYIGEDETAKKQKEADKAALLQEMQEAGYTVTKLGKVVSIAESENKSNKMGLLGTYAAIGTAGMITASTGNSDWGGDIGELEDEADDLRDKIDAYEKPQEQAEYYDKNVTKLTEQREDNFSGQFNANLQAGRYSEDSSEAWADYVKNPTEASLNYALFVDALAQKYSENNTEALDDENVKASWLSKDLAQYLPQFWNQTKAKVVGGAAGTAAGSLVGDPVDGYKVGTTIASGLQSYNQMLGSAYKNLCDLGADQELTLNAAKNEALLSSIIESADTLADLSLLGITELTGLAKLGKTAVEEAGGATLKSILAKYGLSIGSEGLQEGLQQAISIANRKNVEAGKDADFFELLDDSIDVLLSAIQNPSSDEAKEILEAMGGGAKIATMMGSVPVAINSVKTVSGNINAKASAQASQTASDVQETVQAAQTATDAQESAKRAAETAQKNMELLQGGNAETQTTSDAQESARKAAETAQKNMELLQGGNAETQTSSDTQESVNTQTSTQNAAETVGTQETTNVEATSDENTFNERAAPAAEETQAPFAWIKENHEEAVQRLNALLQSGSITTQEYNERLAALNEQYQELSRTLGVEFGEDSTKYSEKQQAAADAKRAAETAQRNMALLRGEDTEAPEETQSTGENSQVNIVDNANNFGYTESTADGAEGGSSNGIPKVQDARGDRRGEGGNGSDEDAGIGVDGLLRRVDASNSERRDSTGGSGLPKIVRLSSEAQDALKNSGVVSFELVDSSGDSAAFSSALSAAREADAKNGWAVTPKSAEELEQSRAKTIMVKNGGAGLAVAPDGDIEAVFKNPNSGIRGALDTLIPAALEQRGNKLDCYGEKLVALYAKYGFVPVARVEFNSEYANPGWTAEKGTPYIYFMMHNGDSSADVIQGKANRAYPTYTQEQLDALPLFSKDDYDKAYNYRDSLLQSAKENQETASGVNTTAKDSASLTDTASNDSGPNSSENAGKGSDTVFNANPGAGTENGKRKLSQFWENTLKSSEEKAGTPDEVSAPLSYLEKSEKQSLAEASARLSEDRQATIEGLLQSEAWSGVQTDAAMQYANELYSGSKESGDWSAYTAWRKVLQEHVTKTAQGLQALSKYTRSADPSTGKWIMDQIVDSINEDRGLDITIPDALRTAFAEATTDEERNAAIDQINQYIADNVPATLTEKINALRYLNMLGNVKTQARNIIGNAANIAYRKVSNSVAELGEIVTGAERTKSVFAGRQLFSEAWNDYANVRSEAMGEGKYTAIGALADDIESKRKIFKSKGLESYRRATNWAMDMGDQIFSRTAYADALGGWLKAHGIKSISDATEEQLQRGRAYAIKEAQEATFRDTNAVSEAFSKLQYHGKNKVLRGISKIGEAIQPFRKTPANVTVRAVEASPIGLMKSLADTAKKLAGKSDLTGSEIISEFAKGLTGSGIYMLGFAMAAAGKARGTEDDEDLDDFQKQQGAQDWSIDLNGDGKSVTFDWATPLALPFAMGIKTQEVFAEQGFSFETALDALGGMSDVLLNMSMMSGVNDALDNLASYNGDSDALPQFLLNSAVSYLTQLLQNSALRQLEQASQQYRMTSYTDYDSDISKSLQYQFSRLSSGILGWDYNQTEYIDAWGRKQDQGEFYERLFNSALNPAYTSKDRSTEIDAELERLYTENKDVEGFPNVLPQTVARSTKIGGEYMSAEEYEQYSITRGQTSLELATDFINSTEYKTMSDEQRAETLSELYKYAATKAENEILDGRGEEQKSQGSTLDGLEESDVAKYLAYSELLNSSIEDEDYIRTSALLGDWEDLSEDVKAAVKESNSDMDNLLYAKEKHVSVAAYYTATDAVDDIAEATGRKTDAASAVAINAKMSSYPDAEKLTILETVLTPSTSDGKRNTTVRRYEAAMGEGISFDTWTKFTAALSEQEGTAKKYVYAAAREAGIDEELAYKIYKSGGYASDEERVSQYDTTYSEENGSDEEEGSVIGLLDYYTNGAGARKKRA